MSLQTSISLRYNWLYLAVVLKRLYFFSFFEKANFERRTSTYFYPPSAIFGKGSTRVHEMLPILLIYVFRVTVNTREDQFDSNFT